MAKSPRAIPNSKDIRLFFHCSRCISDRPDDLSPSEWSSVEVGWTDLGLQVWCKRCDVNMIHIDFGGQKLRANTTRQSAGKV